MEINAISGLREGFNDFLQVPIVHQRNSVSPKFNGQVAAHHRVPIQNNLTMQFYSRLVRGDELFVIFHGAFRKGKDRYPRFDRVQTTNRMNVPFMSFADPTLALDKTMLLAWFLGGEQWDPINDIVSLVLNAVRKSGSKRVVFIGGSGGGFAALRVSKEIPGSMAFVFSPQTDITRYIPGVVEKYFAVAWPKTSMADAIANDPRRFSLIEQYAESDSGNLVYYLQSLNDPDHIRDHYRPFKNQVGVSEASGLDSSSRMKFVLYDSALEGHGPPSADEFNAYLNDALEFYRADGRTI